MLADVPTRLTIEHFNEARLHEPGEAIRSAPIAASRSFDFNEARLHEPGEAVGWSGGGAVGPWTSMRPGSMSRERP